MSQLSMHESTFNRRTTGRSWIAILIAGVLLASASVMAGPGNAFAAAFCPITVKVEGSTTVFPANQEAQPGFQAAAANAGTTLALVASGSGAGLNALRAGTIDVAASSRPLSAAEKAELWAWKVGGDAMILAVQDSAAMSFITDITSAQVKGIWEGTITNWSALGGPSQTIVPRSRTTVSGSQPDHLRLFSISAALEAATITATGLPRLNTSEDEATAAINNPYQIVYTSLANAGRAGLKPLTLNGITATVITVQNNTYPAPRELFLAVRKFTGSAGASPNTRIDNSNLVKGDDFVNYMLTTAGQTAVATAGFVQTPVPANPVIPNWDLNLDGGVSLPDLGAITGKWGQSSTCKGWIRADANNDGGISLPDLGQVTGRWGGTGFVAPY